MLDDLEQENEIERCAIGIQGLVPEIDRERPVSLVLQDRNGLVIVFERGDVLRADQAGADLIEEISVSGAGFQNLCMIGLEPVELGHRARKLPFGLGVGAVGASVVVELGIAGDERPGESKAAILAAHDFAGVTAPQRAHT